MALTQVGQQLSVTFADERFSLIRYATLFYSAVPPSLPLDGAGGLRGDVVDDAVDAAHLVDDAPRRRPKKIVGEVVIVGGHAVGGGDGAQRAHIVVGARIAHDADGAHREQHSEG